MQNKVHKFLVALVLAATAAAGAGCTSLTPLPAPGLENPICPDRTVSEADFRIDHPGIVRIPIDSRGTLYPDPLTHPLDSERLVKAGGSVLKYYGEAYDADRTADEYTLRIQKYIDAGYTPFILIHGFCSTYPEIARSYKGFHRQMDYWYPGLKVVYIEVYWQGYYGAPLRIWTEAQDSSKWAGLGLRRILNRIDSAQPVRILTHSRGAAVICSALWNVGTRNVGATAEFRAAQKATPPPVLANLRVGLLAPAMRAEEFESYEQRGAAPFYYHDKFVLGLNPDDAALKCGGFDWMMGTTLGCTPSEFEQVVAPMMNRGRAHAFAVDFAGSVEHAFEDYLLRDVFETDFLPKLVGNLDQRLVTSK